MLRSSQIMQRAYGTRLSVDPETESLLGAYADLYGRVERTLFSRLSAGESPAALKRSFLVRFGLTSRQFNAVEADLRGKIASIQQRRAGLIRSLNARIERAKKVLRKILDGTNTYHQKRRRLGIMQHRLQVLQADRVAARIRLCFGSRKLFRQQFALEANGYSSHQDWLREWRASRSNQFFVLGSRDETGGCQGCVGTVGFDGTITIRLRLPNALTTRGKYLVLSGLRFAYGHDAIISAIGRNLSDEKKDWEAISWRFVCDHNRWRVLATVSVKPGERISIDGIGVVAVDLNENHLAVTDLDRFGNPVASFRLPCLTRGMSHHQSLAAIGDAVKKVVMYAKGHQKPIVAERLGFDEKKTTLEHRGAGYARKLSAFAYATFRAILQARTYDAGISLRFVNPAFTSVIGEYKFADRYGLSRHQAAALCIGRRGMQLTERPNRRMGDHVAFPLPARNRGKHVWAFWREVARRAAAHQVRGRPDPLGPILVGTDPGTHPGRGPTCDPLVRCRRDSGTRIVSSTVRLTSVDRLQMSIEPGTVHGD